MLHLPLLEHFFVVVPPSLVVDKPIKPCLHLYIQGDKEETPSPRAQRYDYLEKEARPIMGGTF